MSVRVITKGSRAEVGVVVATFGRSAPLLVASGMFAGAEPPRRRA